MLNFSFLIQCSWLFAIPGHKVPRQREKPGVSSLVAQQVKDPKLSLLWHESIPGPELLHAMGVAKKKKPKTETKQNKTKTPKWKTTPRGGLFMSWLSFRAAGQDKKCRRIFCCCCCCCVVFFLFLPFRTTPMAYGRSQARGWIGAVASGLCHSHSNARSEPHPWPTPQFMAMLDPWPTERGQGSNVHPHGH